MWECIREECSGIQIPIPYVFRQSEKNIRQYIIYAEWRPEQEYKVVIDSATFKGVYGTTSDDFEQTLKFRGLEDYATLRLNIAGTGDDAVVQLLNNNGAPVAQERTSKNNCTFYFVRPGKYYMRLFIDKNKNGKWDTGLYDSKGKMQAEEVHYYPRVLDLRPMFEYNQNDWNIKSAAERQKPEAITKQKPDRERVKRNRNAERKFK